MLYPTYWEKLIGTTGSQAVVRFSDGERNQNQNQKPQETETKPKCFKNQSQKIYNCLGLQSVFPSIYWDASWVPGSYSKTKRSFFLKKIFSNATKMVQFVVILVLKNIFWVYRTEFFKINFKVLDFFSLQRFDLKKSIFILYYLSLALRILWTYIFWHFVRIITRKKRYIVGHLWTNFHINSKFQPRTFTKRP